MFLALPSSVRSALYGFTIFVNAMVAVVVTEVKLSVWVLGAVAGFNALVALMAHANVTPDEE